MDFTLSEAQTALTELAGQILADKVPPERLREIEAEGAQDPARGYADDAWHELAKADLLGVALPEADGGGGYGILEACLVLEQIGAAVAPVPYLATVVLGSLPLARFGTAHQRAAWLPGVITGDVVLTAALVEDGDPLPPTVPATTAEPADAPTGDGPTVAGTRWTIRGSKAFVPAAARAERILVPARTGPGQTTVFLVDPRAKGVDIDTLVMTNGEPMGRVTLHDVAVTDADVVGDVDGGANVVAWTTDRALAGLCATQAGVCDAALRLTSRYTSEREQFGAPIATFQAVAQRAADAYVDTEGVRLTARQAAWRLSQDLPADEALAIAKFWAAEGAQRVVHAAQHLHGGIGVDVDYPVHRYFRWAKQLELHLGGGTSHLGRLGAKLAAGPA